MKYMTQFGERFTSVYIYFVLRVDKIVYFVQDVRNAIVDLYCPMFDLCKIHQLNMKIIVYNHICDHRSLRKVGL